MSWTKYAVVLSHELIMSTAHFFGTEVKVYKLEQYYIFGFTESTTKLTEKSNKYEVSKTKKLEPLFSNVTFPMVLATVNSITP